MEVESKWQYYDDITTEEANISTGVGGFSHKILIGSKGYLNTTATVSYNDYLSRLDSNLMILLVIHMVFGGTSLSKETNRNLWPN